MEIVLPYHAYNLGKIVDQLMNVNYNYLRNRLSH
jgi:hypothetical protein